ncbi:MAG: hypothetical protein HFJ59_07535 [Clostridia bacterium]|nr:hypothetical protein [Clostridia bacterium]
MSNNFKNLLINMKVAHKSDLCYYIRNFKEKRRKNGRIICGICKESEGKYKCAVVNEEGNEKHKFTIELSQGDLQDMTEDIIFRDKITQDTLYRDLKEAIIALIIEKCEEFSESINYDDLSRYDNMAAGDIASSLLGWIEQRVYDYLNNIYSLNNEQLEEIKKFYDEGIDLNLAIKRSNQTSVLGSEMLNAEEMKNIRICKEKERQNKRRNNVFNGFKDSLKVNGIIESIEEKKR